MAGGGAALALLVQAAPAALPSRASAPARVIAATKGPTPIRCFDLPLLPTWSTTVDEDRELEAALAAFGKRLVRDDFSALVEFIEAHPGSAWNTALEVQLGDEYYRVGRYSKAIEAWSQVWVDARAMEGDTASLLANRAGSELAMMYARLGRMGDLRGLLNELDARPGRGQVPRSMRGARDGLWSMEHRPEVSFRCGPLALDRICAATDKAKAGNPLIQESKSTTNGFSALEVSSLGQAIGLNYQVAFRESGAEVVLPAVVHWKVGHYAALIARDGALFRAEDPTFANTRVWLSKEALDAESSGYFLVRSGQLPPGWRHVSEAEAAGVWGRGTTMKSDEDATTPDDEQTCKPSKAPMAQFNVHLLLASHHVEDTPVGYRPPVGPRVNVNVSYNSVNGWPDFGLPYSNVSQEWRLNWLTYLVDDPMNPFGDVRFLPEGGGALIFTDFNPTNNVLRNLYRNRAHLVRTGTNSYELRYPDGSRKIFDQPDGSVGTARRIFMSAVVDPAGNAVTIQFDQPGRIASVTDAIGQVTRFFYELPMTNEFIHPSLAWVPPFIVTRVTDPFGRTASFSYGSSINARLGSITDAIGLTSSFRYDYRPGQPDLGMTNLVTPYGTTVFQRGSHRGAYRADWVEITHPNGEKERVEYSEGPAGVPSAEPLGIVPKGVPVRNFILWARNSFHWDRHAYAQGFSPSDYSKARIYHWTHGADYTTASPILESYKEPLEHRVWFSYEGQVNPTFVGTSDRPTSVARTMQDGTTQKYLAEYNALGNVTKVVGPLGREVSFVYGTNDVDVLEVRQTRAGQNELLLSATYDNRHQPLAITDAARQTTRFGYNARGQVLGVTNALGHATTFSYDTNGYLLAVDGPLPGSGDTTRLTYDAAGRLRTVTEPDGYSIALDYDDIDRITRLTYPDGNYEQITYDRLDPEVLRDRLGRETRLTRDSLRQIVSLEDALGRITRFEWCGCGGLGAVIDPLGRTTSWIRDFQGRVRTKVHADGSQVQYEYDPASGWLTAVRNEKDQITKFDYYLDGCLRQKRFLNTSSAPPPVKLTYDPNYRRVLTREDGTNVTAYAYHPISAAPFPGAGRLASIDGPLPNDTITFAYDEVGRIAGRAIDGVARFQTWDEAGRIEHLTNVLGAFAFTWDGVSRRIAGLVFPNGQRTTLTYFSQVKDRRLRRIEHLLPNSSLISRFEYDYTAAGEITDWTEERSGAAPIANHYEYDGADQLTNAVAVQAGTPTLSIRYAYGADQNLTRETVNGAAREISYNALNEPVSAVNDPSPPRSFEWDPDHRLASFSQGSRRTEFGYDGLGRRTRILEKDNGAVVSDRRYVWCGTELCEERDASGMQVLKRFEPHGVQIGPAAGPPPGNYFHALDHLSSIRDVTDSAGQVRASYEYTPFGVRTKVLGDLESDFGFAGMHFHSASELSLTLYRAHDANLARWISRDPSRNQRANLYMYARGDPINLVDPLGSDESRPDLLHVETGNETVDTILGKLKSLWDKTPWSEKTTKPAEKFYEHVETGIEAYNDASRVRQLAGDCSIGELHDPDQTSWDDLKDSGKEGAEMFKIGSKWVKRLIGKVPGLDWVAGPAVDLGPGILDAGAGYIEESHGLAGGKSANPEVQRVLAGGRDD